MNSKKPRSREQRTKPGTAAKQVPVRIVRLPRGLLLSPG